MFMLSDEHWRKACASARRELLQIAAGAPGAQRFPESSFRAAVLFNSY